MYRLLRSLGNLFKPGKIGKKLNPNTYPDNTWYRQHLERNYDVVFLGDASRIPEIQIPAGIKFFDWRLEGQNLQWDFNVTRHFFSILKPKGYVIFPLYDTFVEDLCHKVDESKYYLPMMPYFFTQSKLKMTYIRVCKHIPFFAWTTKIVSKMCCLGGYNYNESYELASKLIPQICDFLSDRDLIPLFVIIQDNNSAKNHLDKILSLFEGSCCKVKVLQRVDDYKWNTIKDSI